MNRDEILNIYIHLVKLILMQLLRDFQRIFSVQLRIEYNSFKIILKSYRDTYDKQMHSGKNIFVCLKTESSDQGKASKAHVQAEKYNTKLN